MTAREPMLERIGDTAIGPFTLLEWTPTAVLAPLALFQTLGGGAVGVMSGAKGVIAVCATAAAGSLVFRRNHAIVVLVTVSVLWAIPMVLWGPEQLSSYVFSMAVAVFGCGAHGSRPQAYVALPCGIGVLLLTSLVDPEGTIASSWIWGLNVIWIFGFGAWVRQRTALVERASAESAALADAAASEDRLQIARDLHDVLAHNLAVMIVQAEAADELLESDPVRAHRALGHVQGTGRAALADIRGLLGTLRGRTPAEGVPPGNGPSLAAVPTLIDAVRDSGLPVELHVDGDLSQVSATAGGAAYRIVQEALTNTLRHAGPVPTEVSLALVDQELLVRVHDSGCSSAPADEVGFTPGHGLRGMRERIEGAGGTLVAEPDPAGGFTVLAGLPAEAAPR